MDLAPGPMRLFYAPTASQQLCTPNRDSGGQRQAEIHYMLLPWGHLDCESIFGFG